MNVVIVSPGAAGNEGVTATPAVCRNALKGSVDITGSNWLTVTGNAAVGTSPTCVTTTEAGPAGSSRGNLYANLDRMVKFDINDHKANVGRQPADGHRE